VDFVGRRKQQRRIEISLQRVRRPETPERSVERSAVVERHAFRGQRGQVLQQMVAGPGEDHARSPARQLREHAPRPRHGVAAVVLAAQRAGPGVEQHQHLGAVVRLVAQVRRDRGRELVHQSREVALGVVHQRAQVREALAAAAFDRVRGQRERRAAETDQRGLLGQSPAHQTQRFADVGHALGGLGHAQAVDLRARAQWLGQQRTLLVEEQLHAHRLQRHQDVAEQDPASTQSATPAAA
jgi:hypothetical protein